MCLSIPARVDKIEGEQATCSVGTTTYNASLQLLESENVKVGDYVLIHTGFAIQKLDAEEARMTLQTFEDFDALNQQMDDEEKQSGERLI
jgi:hydrogenase expression/formation protein HypC